MATAIQTGNGLAPKDIVKQNIGKRDIGKQNIGKQNIIAATILTHEKGHFIAPFFCFCYHRHIITG